MGTEKRPNRILIAAQTYINKRPFSATLIPMNSPTRLPLLVCILAGLLLASTAACGRTATNSNTAPPSFVNGHTAYVPIDAQLHIVDVSDPRQPTQVGSYSADGPISHVQAVGNWVIIGQIGQYEPTSGTYLNAAVQILDVRQPHQPRLSATISLVQPPQAMLWQGDNLYLEAWEGTTVYDMSNPARPSFIAQWPEPSTSFAVADQTLYASAASCNPRSGWCTSVLREMALPITARSTWRTTYEYDYTNIHRMAVREDYLYVGGQGLFAVPRHQLANLDGYKDDGLTYFYILMAHTEKQFYTTYGHKLWVYDTADLAQPQFLYEVAAADTDTFFTQMAVQGDYLYLVSQSALHVYDLAGEQVYGVALLAWEDESPYPSGPFVPQPSPTP
jgi:hypothetical protein